MGSQCPQPSTSAGVAQQDWRQIVESKCMDSGEKVSSNGGSCISINDELCIHGYVYVIYIYIYI